MTIEQSIKDKFTNFLSTKVPFLLKLEFYIWIKNEGFLYPHSA